MTSGIGGQLAEFGGRKSADSMPDPIGKGIGGTGRWPPHEFGGVSAVLGGANALTEPNRVRLGLEEQTVQVTP